MAIFDPFDEIKEKKGFSELDKVLIFDDSDKKSMKFIKAGTLCGASGGGGTNSGNNTDTNLNDLITNSSTSIDINSINDDNCFSGSLYELGKIDNSKRIGWNLACTYSDNSHILYELSRYSVIDEHGKEYTIDVPPPGIQIDLLNDIYRYYRPTAIKINDIVFLAPSISHLKKIIGLDIYHSYNTYDYSWNFVPLRKLCLNISTYVEKNANVMFLILIRKIEEKSVWFPLYVSPTITQNNSFSHNIIIPEKNIISILSLYKQDLKYYTVWQDECWPTRPSWQTLHDFIKNKTKQILYFTNITCYPVA